MQADVRCIRFVPSGFPGETSEIARWRAKYIPKQWRSVAHHVLYRHERAAERNQRYGALLDALALSRCPGGESLHRLALELIHQGEAARNWIAAGGLDADIYAKRRANDSDFLKDVAEVPKLARRLAADLEQEQSTLAIAQALGSSGTWIASLDRSLSPGEAIARFLRAYSDAVKKHHTARRGPFLHREVIGPFIFSEPIDGPAVRRGAARFENSTAVLFGAVLAAREFTGRRNAGQLGVLMPPDGQPLHQVAVELVKAVTGEVIVAEEARSRLKAFIKRNPAVGWIGWPNRDA
jgi:hypothetical protein